METSLSRNHWTMENFKERMTKEEWKAVLLNYKDEIMVGGHMRKLVAKDLGYGVIEVSKAPLEE